MLISKKIELSEINVSIKIFLFNFIRYTLKLNVLFDIYRKSMLEFRKC